MSARRFIVSAMCLSKPGTMGGNSKITIEMIRHLAGDREVCVVVPDDRVATLHESGIDDRIARIVVVPAFPGRELRHPIALAHHSCCVVDAALRSIHACRDDDFFGCQDFLPDFVPGYVLQKKYGYRWYPSAFLFVPSVIENISRRYGFKVIPYALAWLYARFYVRIACRRAAGFVITNESDACHFPRRFVPNRLFPFYGGVNVDQIPGQAVEKSLDVVFCSRLCAQKGIMGFLDVWERIRRSVPNVRLTVIGNGDPDFERELREKGERLGIADSIDWLGYVNNREKYEIYRKARVFVHPTVFDNNGMVAAEALCSGLPVVMYDLPPLRRVYNEGCVKVRFGDKDAFASAVIRLLTDEGHNRSIGLRGDSLTAVRNHWSWRNRVEKFKTWLDGKGTGQ